MASLSRWALALCGGSLLGASACTRPNPAFGEAEPTAGTTGADVSEGSTPGTADATPTGIEPTSVDPTISEPTTIEPTTIEPTTVSPDGSSGTSDPGTDSTTGEPTECILHELAWIEITVSSQGITTFPILCDDAIVLTFNGPLTVTSDSITQEADGGCKGPPPLIETTLGFGTSLTPPSLPPCGKLRVWAGESPDGMGCRWEGFAVLDEFSTEIPYFIGTNARQVPPAMFNVAIELEEEFPCAGAHACPATPGRHGLTFGDSMPVNFGPAQNIFIGSFDGNYDVTNRMASVTPVCDEQVAWTALATF